MTEKIIQDFLRIPGAQQLALFISRGSFSDPKLTNWLLTGKDPPELDLLILRNCPVEEWKCNVEHIISNHLLEHFKVDDLESIANELHLRISKRPDIDDILKRSKLIDALSSILHHTMGSFSELEYDSGIANFLLGEYVPKHLLTSDIIAWMFVDPEQAEKEILEIIYNYDKYVVTSWLAPILKLTLSYESYGDEYDRIQNEDDKLKFLLDTLAKHEDIEDLQTIFDFFYGDKPEAPPAPSIAFGELVKQN